MDSIPEFVMRTGVLTPFAPGNARRDIQSSHVQAITNLPVGQQAGMAGYFGQDEMEGFGYFGAAGQLHTVSFEPKVWLTHVGAGVGAGVASGALLGGAGRRGRGALVGAAVGGLGALAALLMIRFGTQKA
jgi:hypothetical protein